MYLRVVFKIFVKRNLKMYLSRIVEFGTGRIFLLPETVGNIFERYAMKAL